MKTMTQDDVRRTGLYKVKFNGNSEFYYYISGRGTKFLVWHGNRNGTRFTDQERFDFDDNELLESFYEEDALNELIILLERVFHGENFSSAQLNSVSGFELILAREVRQKAILELKKCFKKDEPLRKVLLKNYHIKKSDLCILHHQSNHHRGGKELHQKSVVKFSKEFTAKEMISLLNLFSSLKPEMKELKGIKEKELFVLGDEMDVILVPSDSEVRARLNNISYISLGATVIIKSAKS